MKLMILGATGRTGVPLVQGALQRDHTVTCLVRDPDKAHRLLPVTDDRLRIEVGDALDPAALQRAVANADAVVDVTGPVKGGPKRFRSQVVDHLLPAMHQHDVTRLVFLTGAGVRVDGDQPGLVDRAIRGAMSVLQSDVLEDGVDAVAGVMNSSTAWTVVRAPRLVDADPRGAVRAVANVGGGTGVTLGRADLAEFLLDELEQDTWVKQAPVVSW